MKAGRPVPARVTATLALRRSSAAQRHTPKPRKGTRAARTRAAFTDQERNHR